MFKHLIIALLTVSSVQGSQLLKDKQVYVPGRLGDVRLTHDSSGFKVNNDLVKPQHLCKELRSVTTAKLTTLLKNGYISVDQSCNGDYKLQHHGRLNGGGFGGAVIGAWLGKFGVYALGYGTISVISAATGPLAKGTFVTLVKFCGPVIEVASNKAAIAGGIALGTATGPV